MARDDFPLQPQFFLAVLLITLLVLGFILWRRLQSRRELVSRIAELESLRDAGTAIVEAQLNVAALCELIVLEFGKVIDNSTFQIGLFDGSLYRIMIWKIQGRRQQPRTFDLGDNRGLVGWVRDSRQPLLIHDFLAELDHLPERPRYVSDQPPRSALFIPLVSGDNALGIVAAQSAEPNRFTEEDVQRLTILANQSASAIANARLFEEEKQRSAQLALLGQVAQQINELDQLDDILQNVVRLVPDVFGYHPVNVFGIEPETQDAHLLASSVAGLSQQQIQIPAGIGLIGNTVATRQPIVVNATDEDDRFLPQIQAFGAGPTVATSSELVLPMVVRDQFMGILDIQSEFRDAFDAQTVGALSALANQVGTAMYRAQQTRRQQEQAWLSAAQFQVADALSQVHELDPLIDVVPRLTTMLVGVNRCGILLWNRERERYEGRVIAGADDETEARFAQLRLKLGDWGPLDAVHVGQTQLWTDKLAPWQTVASGSTCLLPLIQSDRLVGVMCVGGFLRPQAEGETGRLSVRQQELLQNIAAQAATALDSQLLAIAQQEEAWVNTALFQVAEAVSSLIELDEILATIIRLVPLLVGVRSALVLIRTEEQRVYRAGPSYGLTEMGRAMLESGEIYGADFVSVQAHQADAHAPATAYYDITLPTWMQKVFETEKAQAFPLHARGELVGVLLVGPTENEQPLTGRLLSILTGIAQQAAIAVVNDQLYQESAARERLEQELDLAHDIQRSLIPAGPPNIPGAHVASHWQAARQVSGDFYDFLPHDDGTWGLVIADVADKGIPASLFMALSRTILRTVAFNRRHPAETLMRVNDLICNDNQSDLFVTMFYAIWDPATDTFTYANAGHNPPLLLPEDGGCTELRTPGIALGVIPDVVIEQRSVKLNHGDLVVMYTDGITEAINVGYDEFGLSRLRFTAQTQRLLEPSDIVESIIEAVTDHAGGTPQFDDMTLVVLKRDDDVAAE